MAHRLDPLLRPGSVAVIGASGRPDSVGEWALKNLLKGGFGGDIYPVNPNYPELQGLRCYDAVSELPQTPDLVIFAVGDHAIEAAFDDAIAAGVPAAVIQSPLVLDNDATPNLKIRIQEKARVAGMLVCGANGMGFYNVRDHVWACGFDSSDHAAPGNMALISHSGSGMSGLIDSDERMRVNLAVSTGNEIGVTMDQYLDYALELPETKVVGLFIETARNPDGFRAALQKSVRKQIPIVALKVGRTEASAQLSVSHSGAMAGDDAAYDAMFDRYGVQRVNDMDELATTMILFAELPIIGSGGLVSLHDSGGERQLMADLAGEAGVVLPTLNAATVAVIEKVIDPELPAINPLDCWSRGGPDSRERNTQCLTAMMKDPGAALGAVVMDRAPYGKVYETYLHYMQHAQRDSGKPVVLVAARQGTGHDDAVVASTCDGQPILDGVPVFLKGVRALFAYRDFLACDRGDAPQIADDVVEKWRLKLPRNTNLDEVTSLKMFTEFRLPSTSALTASDEESLRAVAKQLGFPLALKTAKPGVLHKSDVGGVVLDIATEEQLMREYAVLSKTLGNSVVAAPMADAGVEMILGVRRDPQFGPVVVIGCGGINAEVLQDAVYVLPPFSAQHARQCVDKLKMRPLLDGVRGRPAADVDAFCETAARFSVMVDALQDNLAEVDANPVIVHASGCTIVDALVVTV